MTIRSITVSPQAAARLRRAAMDALRRDFPGWAFAHEPTVPLPWVAAPGHPLTPRLRVLRASDRVEAADATALRLQLAQLPVRRRR